MNSFLRRSESATTKTLSIGVRLIVFAYVAFMVYRVTRKSVGALSIPDRE